MGELVRDIKVTLLLIPLHFPTHTTQGIILILSLSQLQIPRYLTLLSLKNTYPSYQAPPDYTFIKNVSPSWLHIDYKVFVITRILRN